MNQPLTDDFVWLALDSFKKDNLLEENDQFAINFNGLSRRQIIRKVGLASPAALPVIASVVIARQNRIEIFGLSFYSPKDLRKVFNKLSS